jgi:hypothetical protein
MLIELKLKRLELLGGGEPKKNIYKELRNQRKDFLSILVTKQIRS